MRQQLGAMLVIGGLALATACSGPAAASPASTRATAVSVDGVQHVTIDVDNSMSFTPSTITVRAGQPVQVTLRNGGVMPHDFSIAGGVAEPVKIEATGNETASATFTIDQPGDYPFVCAVPGHGAAGMKGTITAQ